MEKQKTILVRKNTYWLSEIGALFFKYQVGYQVYDYSENAELVKKGVDLLVLNHQNIPTYILCMGNTFPFDKLYFPIMENGKQSRLLSSEADFVMFYDLNQGGVSLIDLPLLQEKINYNYTSGAWKGYKVVDKEHQKGIQVSKDDEVIKEALSTYKLNKDLWDKAVSIIKWRIKNKLIHEPKVMETTRIRLPLGKDE